MSENCSIYKQKLKELNESLEFEYRIGIGNKYNDLALQHNYIQLLRIKIENMKLLIEKHCTNN